MTMPNFFIIGAIRSGTTSIYNYLAQHPEIYVSPVKEPAFFLIDNFMSMRGSEHRDTGDARSTDDHHGAVADLAARDLSHWFES
ncbi:MAG: sulfotransferase, partial [Deltaproteobacteria bacterium]|nr:sulfotransferase [Deltaproteobacteria bacterium]